MTLDRTIQPPIKPIEAIVIPRAEQQLLPNGIPFYSINIGEEEVVRIDCMFRAGIHDQSYPLVASFTNQMLKEGTTGKSAVCIAERLDFYGSWLHLSCTHHYSYITLYSLNKYLPHTISLLGDILLHATFPEKEFQIYRNTRKHQFLIEYEKVQYLAHKNFQTLLYGTNHPYGKSANLSDFDDLKRDWLKEFYTHYYTLSNCSIIASGKVDNSTMVCIKDTLGQLQQKHSVPVIRKPEFNIEPSDQRKLLIEKADSIQSAIRIGRPMFNRKHPDYHSFRILNTALGGYFGSRLMSNIREEKGYTYGIQSSITTHLDTGHFHISTQTGTEFVEPLIHEVYHEMERLCTKPIPDEELEMVKGYMLGEHIRMFDGGFALADTFISLLANELDYSFYEKNVETICSITPQQIQHLAANYFQPEAFYEVIAGQINKKVNRL